MCQEAAPSVAPSFDVTVYIVLNDFGNLGKAYLETDEEKADVETVVEWMLEGQYSKPLRVVAFNTAGAGHGTCRKISHGRCCAERRLHAVPSRSRPMTSRLSTSERKK